MKPAPSSGPACATVRARALRLLQLGLFYLMLLWLGAMLLLGNVAVLPLALLPRNLRQPLLQRLISATFRVFLAGCRACGLMHLDLRELDRIDALPGGMLLVANHPAMIDVFLVISRVRRALCLMKASLGANAFLGVGAALAGYIPNRGGERLIRDAAGALRGGHKLLVFPEGTRTGQAPLDPLKPGVGLMAKVAAVPLQTIVIRTNSPYLRKGWPLWRPPVFPLVYQARLGPQVLPGASVENTMLRLRETLLQQLSLPDEARQSRP